MIKLDRVTKTYGNNKALDNLCLEVLSGEIYGLLGANGAGKSTTLNMLLGFTSPDSGSIKILDSKTNKLIEKSQIGYIAENVNLYPYLTGIENLDYFCRIADIVLDFNTLTDFLVQCGLEKEFHSKKVSEYSKGMRQKVGISIALAKNANVYLLDEPASGLDPVASNELTEILKKLSSKGATILMASHDIFRVRETCDKIGILRKGCLIKEMKSNEVTSKELENTYLTYMQA